MKWPRVKACNIYHRREWCCHLRSSAVVVAAVKVFGAPQAKDLSSTAVALAVGKKAGSLLAVVGSGTVVGEAHSSYPWQNYSLALLVGHRYWLAAEEVAGKLAVGEPQLAAAGIVAGKAACRWDGSPAGVHKEVAPVAQELDTHWLGQ